MVERYIKIGVVWKELWYLYSTCMDLLHVKAWCSDTASKNLNGLFKLHVCEDMHVSDRSEHCLVLGEVSGFLGSW